MQKNIYMKTQERINQVRIIIKQEGKNRKLKRKQNGKN